MKIDFNACVAGFLFLQLKNNKSGEYLIGEEIKFKLECCGKPGSEIEIMESLEETVEEGKPYKYLNI